MISGLIAGYQAAQRLAVALLAYVWAKLNANIKAPKTRRVLSVFCGEVAVLVAVFPTLETYIQAHGSNIGQAPNDAAYLRGVSEVSGGIAVAFLLAAIIMAPEKE